MTALNPHFVQKSPWAWAFCGALVGSLVAVLLFAPAHWLGGAMLQISAGRLLLTETRGTLWDGSAQLRLVGGKDSSAEAVLPGRVAWQLRPQWNSLQVSLDVSCCALQPLQLQIIPRWGGSHLVLKDGQSQWPAALLVGLGTPWNTVQAAGTLSLLTRNLSLTLVQGRLALAGQAQLEALGISSRLSTLKPMGSYRLTLKGGDTTSLELATLDGSLYLTGTGQWVGSRLHFQGEASAQAERLDDLSNLLNIIGRRDGARSIIKVG